MSTVTVDRAVADLSAAVEQLWSAVGELVLIVLEDQPEGDGLAVADDLVETVSELQGSIAAARDGLAGARSPVSALPDVAGQLQAAALRYWRDVRGHVPVAQLRAATRARGGDWPGWRRVVEQSAQRCADPFDAVAAAIDAGWREVCRLVPTVPSHWNSAHSPDQLRSAP